MGPIGGVVLGLVIGLAIGALAVLGLVRAVGRTTGVSGWRGVLALAARGLVPGARTDGVAAQRALARRVRAVSSRTASGGRVAATSIEVHASPEDHALIDGSIGVVAAAEDLTVFYRNHAREHAWRIVDDPVVTIVRDISLRPRQAYARATVVRPAAAERPGVVEQDDPGQEPEPAHPSEPARIVDDAVTDVLPRGIGAVPAPAGPQDASTDVLPRHGFAAAEGDTRSFALNPTEVLGPGDLVVVHGTDVRTVPSARGSATIGRSAHNDIVIDRPGVSRDHAVLERREDGWWVVPGTSKNGTRLDGRILDGPVRIEGQGELSLGRGVRLRLSVEPVAQRERA